MKRLITFSLSMLVIAVMAASSCSAVAKVKSFAVDITGIHTGFGILNVAPASYLVDVTGATTLTATEQLATLTGLFGTTPAKVWRFEYQKLDNSWSSLIDLVNSSSATPPSAVSTIERENAGGFLVTAKAFKISYNFDLAGVDSSASGTGGLTATAVPEPSSLIALATGVVGMVGILRRRRA